MTDTLLHLQISKENASVVKSELMPKDNNNFYPYRYSTKIAGLYHVWFSNIVESVEKWDDLDILMHELVSCRLTSVDNLVLSGLEPSKSGNK